MKLPIHPPRFNSDGQFIAVFEIPGALYNMEGQLWLVIDLEQYGSLKIGPAVFDESHSMARFEGQGFPPRAFSVPHQVFELLWNGSTNAG